MTRVQQVATVTRYDVLNHLAASVGPAELMVHVGATVIHHRSVDFFSGDSQIGMLQLGSGRHENFGGLLGNLAKGAIIAIEDCAPDSDAYNYMIDWAARGYLSTPTEARHWPGLAICTYLGGGK